jgi:hypothetical protein
MGFPFCDGGSTVTHDGSLTNLGWGNYLRARKRQGQHQKQPLLFGFPRRRMAAMAEIASLNHVSCIAIMKN